MSTGCYFGCATWHNRVAWVVYGLCMFVGFILWVTGLSLYLKCYNTHVVPCTREQQSNPNRRDPTTGSARNCFDFANDNFCPIYSYYGVWTRGVVVLGACQLLLLYFCCCAARPDDEEYTVTITPYPAPGANTISGHPASSAVYGSAGHGVLRLRQGASGTPVSAPGASGHGYGPPLMMTAVVGQPVAAQVAEGWPAEGVPLYHDGQPVYSPGWVGPQAGPHSFAWPPPNPNPHAGTLPGHSRPHQSNLPNQHTSGQSPGQGDSTSSSLLSPMMGPHTPHASSLNLCPGLSVGQACYPYPSSVQEMHAYPPGHIGRRSQDSSHGSYSADGRRPYVVHGGWQHAPQYSSMQPMPGHPHAQGDHYPVAHHPMHGHAAQMPGQGVQQGQDVHAAGARPFASFDEDCPQVSWGQPIGIMAPGQGAPAEPATGVAPVQGAPAAPGIGVAPMHGAPAAPGAGLPEGAAVPANMAGHLTHSQPLTPSAVDGFRHSSPGGAGVPAGGAGDPHSPHSAGGGDTAQLHSAAPRS